MTTRVARIRRSYRVWPVLVSIGIVAVLGGASYVAFPGVIDETVIGTELPFVIQRLWALEYLVGGTFLLVGVYRLDARWEVAGLLLVAGCYLSYSYALVAERAGSSSSIALPVFFGIGVGCVVRAFILRYEPGAVRCSLRR